MPPPSSPTRLAAGTRTSVNSTIGWWWLIVCVYAGVRTTETPGVGRSTRKSRCSAGSPAEAGEVSPGEPVTVAAALGPGSAGESAPDGSAIAPGSEVGGELLPRDRSG